MGANDQAADQEPLRPRPCAHHGLVGRAADHRGDDHVPGLGEEDHETGHRRGYTEDVRQMEQQDQAGDSREPSVPNDPEGVTEPLAGRDRCDMGPKYCAPCGLDACRDAQRLPKSDSSAAATMVSM